jgi:hypothetical protein
MSESLLTPTFLFRFSVSCRRLEKRSSAAGIKLGEEYALPSFGQLAGQSPFADLRAAWSERGLFFDLRVRGKKQTVWCRSSRLEDSDGLHVWIDTRDAHNIHRASRFCHYFVFLPQGSGPRTDDPTAVLVPIHRAREEPRPVAQGQLLVSSECQRDGYRLLASIPAQAMTGYDPAEQPRLGFSYQVQDRELGWQLFSIGPEFPVAEDPSLWGTLELVESPGRGTPPR